MTNPIYKYSLILIAILVISNPISFANKNDDQIKEIEEYLQSIYSSDNPGALILVKRGGNVIFKNAYGLADISFGEKLTTNYSMPIGSLTKQFTAMIVFILEQEGKLNITDKVVKYFPKADKLKLVTIHQLLTHTSGVKDYFKIDKWREDLSEDITPQETLQLIQDEELEFVPGTNISYSNSGYHILGLIIEKVTGKPLNDVIIEKILVPLNMEKTFFIEDEDYNHLVAKGYEFRSDEFVLPFEVSKTRFFAGGSIITSLDDLSKWDDALYSNALLNYNALEKYFSPYVTLKGDTLSIASGWECLGNTVKIYGHGGGINGYVCQVYRIPSERIYVAVLMNSIYRTTTSSASTVAQELLNKIFLNFHDDNSSNYTISPEILQRYDGSYRLPNNSIRVIKYRDAKLYYIAAEGKEFELTPVSDTKFTAGRGSTFEFTIDNNDQVTSFKLFTGRGKPLTAYRLLNEKNKEK